MLRDRSVQKDLAAIGESGCYFLSLLVAAERIRNTPIDVYATYRGCLTAKIIDEDCYVNDPGAVLTYLTGFRYTCEHKDADYPGLPEEIVILRFSRREKMVDYAHFVLAGPDGSVEYDPLGNSVTVRSGTLVSKRVLRRL